jgi:hypothetical protein
MDTDTPYHAAVGKLIREHGILHSFPWTPFSWLSDRYADDRLLFHLLFVPFAGRDWVTASRIVGTLAGAGILTALYLLFRAERVRFAGVWALLPLTASLLFIFRFLLVLPHLLSLALAPVFLWAAARGRLAAVAVVSFIYPWTYVAFWQLPLLLLIAAETARLVAGERVQWKPAAVFIAGVVAGIAIHPNTVNLLKYNWVVMYDVLIKNAWLPHVGFDMGTELEPYPLAGWAQGLVFIVLMIAAAAVLSWRNRKQDTLSLAFTLAALGFCILTIRSVRFAEYFVPFAVAALAFASKSVSWRFLPLVLLVVSLSSTIWVGSPSLSALTALPDEMPPRTAATLQRLIPAGERVFTTRWDVTGVLLATLPDRYFLVALDPTLFYLKDPELYRLWYRLTYEAPPGLADTIRTRFGTRFVIINYPMESEKMRRFSHRLGSEAGVKMLFSSKQWLLFDIGPPPGPP